jgi:hypothetical protein
VKAGQTGQNDFRGRFCHPACGALVKSVLLPSTGYTKIQRKPKQKQRTLPSQQPTTQGENRRNRSSATDGGQVPAAGGEGGRRDGVNAGDRPGHRRAPRPGRRRRRHLLPQAGPPEFTCRCHLLLFGLLRFFSDQVSVSWAGPAAEKRRRGGGGAQGQGDHCGRGRLPRLGRSTAQAPHRHVRQGENWVLFFSGWLRCQMRILASLQGN